MEIVNKITETVKQPKKLLKPLLIIGLSILALYLAYRIYLHFAYKVDNSKIQADIESETSDKNIQKLVREGVDAIINNPSDMRMAQTFSKASGTDINEVLVSESIAKCKENGYLN